MKYIINFKAEDLVATTPDAIRHTQGTPLAGILEAVLSDVDFRLEVDLAENCQIAHVWGTDDVRQLRPDLDEDRAWAVLQVAREKLEHHVGITRDMVERIAEVLYPRKPERHWHGLIDVWIADTGGYGQGEVINRLRDMAGRLAGDMPGVRADVDPGSVRLLGHDETQGE